MVLILPCQPIYHRHLMADSRAPEDPKRYCAAKLHMRVENYAHSSFPIMYGVALFADEAIFFF